MNDEKRPQSAHRVPHKIRVYCHYNNCDDEWMTREITENMKNVHKIVAMLYHYGANGAHINHSSATLVIASSISL